MYIEVFSLNQLEKQRRSVLNRFREDLQQVAVVVKVHQDVQLAQLKKAKLQQIRCTTSST